MIKTNVISEDLLKHKTDCLVIVRPEEKRPGRILQELDRRFKGAIADAYKVKRFEGKANQTLLLNSLGSLKAQYVLLVGVGKSQEISLEKLRQAAGTAARLCEKSRCKKITFHVPHEEFGKTINSDLKPGYDLMTCAFAEGAYLSLYHFDDYKKLEEKDPPWRIGEIVLLSTSSKNPAAMRKATDRAGKIAAAVCAARSLILHPSNTVTPSFLAETARKMAAKRKIACKILGRAEMQKLGMGALLGVARGSDEPPKFIILEYRGAGKKTAPVVIVGKGITFDTGGISLKPPQGMDEMKMDMSGGAVTICALQAVADLKLPVNVVGLVPATENMPGGSAIKPGDVLRSMSGKTIETLNTDAEGRLILADALAYAARYKPKAVIDLATLTGAVIVALGHAAAAILGNDPELIEKLKQSGVVSGEKVWELPLWEEFEKALKSDISDLKNIAAPTVGAGTIVGAAFLKAFAGDQPWAHIDIAGVSWSSEDKPYVPKGASGFGLRLLLDYLET